MQLVQRRIGLLFAAFLLLLAIAALKASWLGVVRAGDLKRAAVTQQEADIVIPARRGAITDANGIDLAVSEPAVDIAATPYLVKDATVAAAKLAPLIGRSEDELLRQLARRDTGFVYLGRGIPAAKAARAEKLNLAGLEFIPRYRRGYPRDWMASQMLGSVGTDGQGLGGLEYAHEDRLRGRDGERRLVKDAMGNPIEMRDTRPVEPGADVRLTLDANLQDQAEEVLNEVGEKWQPKGATAIVMEPHSGAILALANWPRVNANALNESPDYARQNRAVAATYEPGSTFKAFTFAAALEDGKVTPDSEVQHPARSRRRRPRAPRRRGARLGDAHHERDPQVLLEHRHGADRPPGRHQALRLLDPPLGLRQADRRRPAGRGAGARAPARAVLGRDDGQPADRPGDRGHVDADGRRLRRDRQRRRPAPAAHRRRGRRQADQAPRRAGA